MGEILGLGLSHNPGLIGLDQSMAAILKRTLNRPDVPADRKDPATWPETMREEWGTDEGATAAVRHREGFVTNLRKLRGALDEFNPDFLVVWGDDQYENFHEDLVPAFCVYAYPDVDTQPLLTRGTEIGREAPPNIWGEPHDKVFTIRTKPEAAKYLARSLINQKFDVAYSYQTLHYKGLSHAFVRVPLYLDYDRKGFDYPMVPVTVNCYGSRVIAHHGGSSPVGKVLTEADLDPPSPTPDRCMEFGAAIARAFLNSPWRVALVASSSWSHAFLTPKNDMLYPDVPGDRRLYEILRDANYDAMHKVSLAEIEDAGQQECLNWFCLAGAMEELGRKPDHCELIESYVFNSNKCFAIYKP